MATLYSVVHRTITPKRYGARDASTTVSRAIGCLQALIQMSIKTYDEGADVPLEPAAFHIPNESVYWGYGSSLTITP